MLKRTNAANTAKAGTAASPSTSNTDNGNKTSNEIKVEKTNTSTDAPKDNEDKNKDEDKNKNGKEADTSINKGTTSNETKTDIMDVDTADGDYTKAQESEKMKKEEGTEVTVKTDKADETSTSAETKDSAIVSKGDIVTEATGPKLPTPVITGTSTTSSAASTTTADGKTPAPSTPIATGPTAHPLDEIMAMLKTGYPLLALSMETMVDQIQLKFKPQADEDMYRLVVALYNEGAQVSLILILAVLGASLDLPILLFITAIAFAINES